MGQMGQVFRVAGGEVVDAENSMALAQQTICQVRAEETSRAGYKYTHDISPCSKANVSET
jgi:hypothetical protein